MEQINKAGTETEVIAQAIAGAYLLVAFSDGRFEKSEEVGFRQGLMKVHSPSSVSDESREAQYDNIERAFATDYDGAAEQVLELIASVGGIAKSAIVQAAQSAVIADRVVTPQEEYALKRLSDALGLKEGAL